MNNNIAIIGGGISGLSTAYFLKNNNINDITIFESKSNPGGVIKTFKNNKYKYEVGPNTLSVSDMRVKKMFSDLNLNIVHPNSTASNRFIFKNKTIYKLPTSFLSFLTTDFFSFKTKIRVLFEYFRKNKSKTKNESIYDFFKRKFNSEISDYVINPFIAGTFSGNPKKLSLKHAFPILHELDKNYGSIVKGFTKKKKDEHKIKREIVSFENGLYDLISSLSDHFKENIKCNSNVISILKNDKKFIIKYLLSGKEISETFDKVIITIPTYQFKNISFDEDLISHFSSFNDIYYPPISTATISFKKQDFTGNLNGFGLLIPEKEEMNILGVLYLSSMFENSSPKDEILITVFVGGARQPELANLKKDDLQNLILTDLNKLYKISGKPVYFNVKYWEKSIPQYELDYQKYLDNFNYIESNCPGIFFNGNFKDGISLENNIINSLKISERICG